MKATDTQIADVIQIIYDEWQLSPKNTPISIYQGKFDQLPNADSILAKLQHDDSVITILERPNEIANVPADEFQFLRTSMGNKAFEDAMSYKLEVHDSFHQLYEDVTGHKDQSIKYELKYDGATRKLTFSGTIIANPDFFSENELLLDFIFKAGNANRRIRIEELLDYMKVKKLNSPLQKMLYGLNIRGTLRSAFFPHVSTKGIEFINPITHSYAAEHKLPEIVIEKPSKNSPQ